MAAAPTKAGTAVTQTEFKKSASKVAQSTMKILSAGPARGGEGAAENGRPAEPVPGNNCSDAGRHERGRFALYFERNQLPSRPSAWMPFASRLRRRPASPAVRSLCSTRSISSAPTASPAKRHIEVLLPRIEL